MAKLYVIDQTSRMYGFNLTDEGLNLNIDGVDHLATPDNIPTEALQQMLRSNGTLTVMDTALGVSTFSGSHLIGMQVRLNE